MKKLVAVILAVAMMCMAALAETEALAGRTMPDVSVLTTDGHKRAVSRLLGEKDAVVLCCFDAGSPDSRADLSMMDDVRNGPPLGCYNVCARDQYGDPVPGVVVRFCDEACRLYTTDDEGIITFTGRPVRYNVQVQKMPEGYSCDMSFEAVCDGSGEWVVIEAIRDAQSASGADMGT